MTTRTVLTVLNAEFDENDRWTGSVTVWQQQLNQSTGYYENIPDSDDYMDIVHIDRLKFAFPDLEGESHTVDLTPHRAKLNELFAKVESIENPTKICDSGQMQWHLNTKLDEHPENSFVVQAGKYMVRVSCMLYQWPNNEEPTQKLLCSVWKSAPRGKKKGFRF